MQGWRPVEDLIGWGFGHTPVVMANEAHSGLARRIRTRRCPEGYPGRQSKCCEVAMLPLGRSLE